jgi:hypothetical protein
MNGMLVKAKKYTAAKPDAIDMGKEIIFPIHVRL